MSNAVNPPESVYNHLEMEEVHSGKPPRYTSKFRTTVLREEKQNKCAMRTMGPANVEVPAPDKYLLKHSKEPKLPENFSAVAPKTSTLRRPPVPLRTEKPLMGLQTRRDFVKTAHEDILQKTPQPIYADTKRGDKHLLENSGLVPKYRKKKDYGEIPKYLHQRNEETRRAQEDYDQYVKDQRRQGSMKQLSEAQRHAILEGLRKNWDKLHTEYQSLSVVIDTLSKKAHKERLEMTMKQLEADIDLFEKFNTIYISNN
ncbi:enkurin-like isoform X2 [Genypterus blacodes]|uniref:enkurin-like isoform X2 n=1 Tax=Genypterus blacodes TaxID=154954 RepID=UPI003F771F21